MPLSAAAAVAKVLAEFISARESEIAGHPLASFIRDELAESVAALLEDGGRYRVRASPGQGNWANVPWVAVFDTLVTTSAQSGYYPVILFRGDMSGIYLSLNQGVTEAEEKYKSGAADALRVRAHDFRLQLGGVPASLSETNIDLRATGTRLADLYEAGNICAAFYPTDELPTEVELREELRHMLGLYDALVYNETVPSGSAASEADETVSEYIEDLRRFRYHKRIERNSALVKEVKKRQGTRCKACGLSFVEFYGSIGAGYIEAHHLTPLGALKGQKLALDPETDFAVLCANCHAMIHRSHHLSNVAAFREAHLGHIHGALGPSGETV